VRGQERIFRVLVVVAVLAGGYTAGRVSATARVEPAAAARCPGALPADTGVAPERIADLVRTAVRAEIASAGATARTAEPGSEREAAPARLAWAVHPTASAEAGEAADLLLDHALATGRWEVEDQAELRRVLGQLEPAHEGALLQRLAAALNAGELKIGFDGPMF
jgi:hypothetical protein